MAIVNRSLDASEQNAVVSLQGNPVNTGVTLLMEPISSAATLRKVSFFATGLSGAPAYALRIQRFIVGSGATVIDPTGAATVSPAAFGTSGAANLSLLAAGNTLLNLLPGDVLSITSSGANTAVTNLSVAAVISYVQDIKTTLGV